MKTYLAGSLFLSLLAACATSPTGDSPQRFFDAATTARLDAAVDKVMADHGIPGIVVGAWFPGRGEYVVAKGTRDKATGAPITTDVHFRVGSNTKAFIGTIVLQLADEGRIRLDDPAAKYFPWLKRGNEITIRMLLNMTSGIPSYTEQEQFEKDGMSEPHRAWTRQGLLDYVKDMPLQFDPGTKWHYSNTNTVLLGIIIEKETGKPVAQNLEERIFVPFRMTGTSWGKSQLPAPYTHGYSFITPDKLVDVTGWNPDWTDAAGQIVSTMPDMKRWAKTLATPALISPAMHAQRTTWVTVPGVFARGHYGLAVGTAGGWYHHQGSMPGYNTIAAYLPEMDATIVVLSNTETNANGRSPAVDMLVALSEILAPQYSP